MISRSIAIGNCLTINCQTNVLKFFVFNINYRSNSTPQFFCIFSVIFKIFLVVVFLTDSGECYYIRGPSVNFESCLDFSFFMRINGFAKLFVFLFFAFIDFRRALVIRRVRTVFVCVDANQD